MCVADTQSAWLDKPADAVAQPGAPIPAGSKSKWLAPGILVLVPILMALAWQDKLSFMLDDKLVVKRLKFEDLLKEQAGRAATAINNIAGKVSPSLSGILPTGAFAADATPAPEAVKPFPHLMIMQPRDPKQQPYFFNLDTAAFDELRRSTAFRWASQERLTRRPAQQAIGMGDEKLTLKGAVFPGFRGGIKQLDTLRTLGGKLQPMTLTTGYGDVLGTWCMTSVEEEQSALLGGGGGFAVDRPDG